MIFRPLGTTGVTVSALCFGTMSFGDADAADVDAATASAVYSRCRDAGINFFDCANVYGRGKAETTLGRLMHGHRDELVITSKVGFRMRDGLNGEGLSRRSILREVEDSLRRLQTDRIDVYFVHRFDPATPMAEVIAALDTLVQQGKILYPAVSNWAAWQIAKALGIAEHGRWKRFAVLQPMYNLVKRQAEVELLPLAAEEGLGVIPYSPLGGGLLTGKYGVTTRPERGRLMENQMYQKRYGDEGVYEVAESFTEYALARGIHPATLAVRWVMHHPAVTAPIIGARNVQQLEASLAAANEPLAVDERAAISALSPAPAVATDRSEERVMRPEAMADLTKQPNSENCFICGVKNVAGAHVHFYEQRSGEPGAVTGEVIARFTGRAEHQGYPGRMHGGIITGILDETIGRAINIGEGEKPGTWGVTAELTVRFRKPVPLGVELTAKGRIIRDIHFLFEGEGEIYLPDGQVAASAHGKFVRLKLDSITANDPVVAQEQLGWRIYADE